MERVCIFCFSQKLSHKSCLSSEYLSEYKISWSYIDWLKFCIHLRSLNVRHFGVVAAAEYLPIGCNNIWCLSYFFQKAAVSASQILLILRSGVKLTEEE
jgi:hypothetical protein